MHFLRLLVFAVVVVVVKCIFQASSFCKSGFFQQ